MLAGQQVILTPLARADLPGLWELINDRDTVLRSAPFRPVPESAHDAWFESLMARVDVVIFGIRLVASHDLVGSCQLHSIHPIHRSAELQIRLRAGARGQGYGSEAVRLLLRFAFRDLNLNRVKLDVFETNAAAIRVYEKAGFVTEGVLRQAAHIDGAYIDVRIMGVLRADYVDV